ncbi:MAG: hypothetical protein ABIL68_17355 [bacterium]
MKSFSRILVVSLLVLSISTLSAQEKKGEEVQEKSSSGIEQITIKHTGFMKDEEVIIRYRRDDQEIVEVLDEGKTVLPEEFYKYEPMLWNFLEYRKMEKIIPRLSRLRRDLRAVNRVDSLHRRELSRLQREVDSLRSNSDAMHGRIRTPVTEALQRATRELTELRVRMERFDSDEQLKAFLKDLQDEGIITSTKDLQIKFRDGKCSVNGKKISEEKSERIKELWKKHGGREINDQRFTIIL